MLEGIWNFLKGIVDFFSGFFEYFNPESDKFCLKWLFDFFVNLISYINPFSENFFVYKLIDLLGDLLKFLFVPSEERINAITSTVSSKFQFVDSIKIAINSIKDMINNVGNAPKLTLNLGATKYTEASNYVVLDLSWYSPFKPYGDIVLTGFIYVFFIWRMFISAPNIIHGLGGSVAPINDIYTKLGGNKK